MKKLWIVLGCVLLIAGCSGESSAKEKQKQEAAPVVKTEKADDIRDVSFVAVGDNLIHGAIFHYNAKGDGTY
ncbi:CapA family protein, partial [Erysipelatoclostridium ramosum]|nr:CapA family protein [Thomasclavelia ramosa]